QRQGLAVADQPKALQYLQYVGGYRLKGYWHHVVDPLTNQFPAGYAFERIADRCEFDRELRSATIEAIDRLEVAIRSTIANYLSLRHGPHWFLNSAIFKPTAKWGSEAGPETKKVHRPLLQKSRRPLPASELVSL
ncbi:MAG: Abi family protein, partial [Stenotrophomonas sp.]